MKWTFLILFVAAGIYFLLIALLTTPLASKAENSKFFVFIGEKISVESVPTEEGKVSLDSEYGNYLDDLFLLRQHGVLRARGDFQEF